MLRKFLKACSMLVFTGVFAISAVSCGNSQKEENIENSNMAEIIEIEDNKGKVKVKKNPKTVVTFDYGVLDILDSMGIEVAGLPKSVLPDKLSKYENDKYVNLGTLKEPDFEAINNLKPDLIILGGRQESMIDKFREIADTIYLNIDGSKYFESLAKNTNVLSKIFDKQDIVNKQLLEIENKVKQINSYVTSKNLNTLIVMVSEGDLKTYGLCSRYGLIYSDLGFKPLDDNIEISTHGQKISFEYIVDKNPMYMFVIDRGAALRNKGTAKSILDNELIKSTDAYKNDKILYMDSQIWYTASGGFNTTKSMLYEIWNFIKDR